MPSKSSKKLPFALRWIRWALPKCEKIFPTFAAKWAVKLFFTPYKFLAPEKETAFARTGSPVQFQFNGAVLEGLAWGKGPIILFMHGWAGRGSQFYCFIPELVRNGFQCIVFDGPAHGKSAQKTTHLLEMTAAFQQVLPQAGEVKAVIGHSLGGSVILRALLAGFQPDCAVLIATPAIAADVMKEYRRNTKAGPAAEKAIRAFIREKAGVEFEETTAAALAAELNTNVPILLCYDENDREAPPAHGEKLASHLPSAQLRKFEGNSHTRMLRSEEVVKSVIEFVKGNVGISSGPQE